METIECSKCGAIFEKTGAKDKLRRFKDKRFVATFHCPNCDARVLIKDDNKVINKRIIRLEIMKEQARRLGDQVEVRELQEEIDRLNEETKSMATQKRTTDKDDEEIIKELEEQLKEAKKNKLSYKVMQIEAALMKLYMRAYKNDSKTTDSLFKGQKVTAIKSEQGLREGETYTVLGEENIIKQIVGEDDVKVYKLQDSSGNIIAIECGEGLFYEAKDDAPDNLPADYVDNLRKKISSLISQGNKEAAKRLLSEFDELASSIGPDKAAFHKALDADPDEENESLKVKIGDIKKNMDAARKMGYDTEPYQKEIDKLETKTKDEFSEVSYKGQRIVITRGQRSRADKTESWSGWVNINNKVYHSVYKTSYDQVLTEMKQIVDKVLSGKDSKTKDTKIERINELSDNNIINLIRQFQKANVSTNTSEEFRELLAEASRRGLSAWEITHNKIKDRKAAYMKGTDAKDSLSYVTTYKGCEIVGSDENLTDKFLTTCKGYFLAASTLEELKRKIDQREKQDSKDSSDVYTKDPLTKKGEKILAAMKKAYGEEKGKQIFYASKNKGTISGVDSKSKNGPSINDPAIRNQIRVALQTLKMPSAMLGVMGGTTKEQAKEILRKYGVKFEDSKMKDWLDPEARVLSEKVLRKMKEIHKRTKQTNIYDLFDDAIRGLGITGKIKEDVRILILQGANHRYTEEFIFKDSKIKGTKDDYKTMKLADLLKKAKEGYFELQSDPKPRNHVEIRYPNGKKEWIFVEDQEIKITIGEDPVNPNPAEQKVEGNGDI